LVNYGKIGASGWLIIDKPRGLGSTQVVSRIKRLLREGGYNKTKVGHGGTLDPLAEGVLPIALGEATKLAGRMLNASKTYTFTIKFGSETDTLDTEGEVIARSSHRPPIAAISEVLEHFTGEIEQEPPAYSALMVDGKRAYKRARAGEAVQLKKRSVSIHSLDLTNDREDSQLSSTFQNTSGRPDPYDPAIPLELAETVTLTTHVSKGTYIRSLARDICHSLGTLGHVIYLRRLTAGPFSENQSISLDKLGEVANGASLFDFILPFEAGLDDIPVLRLDPEDAQAVKQGRIVSGMPQGDGLYLAKSGETPIALVECVAGTTKVVRGLNF
jgi:tRNA pseudouridine55 synthase